MSYEVFLSSGGKLDVVDEEGNRQFSFPQTLDAGAAAIFGYERGLELGKKVGRAILQDELRRLLDAARDVVP